jgi:hypothetical protein
MLMSGYSLEVSFARDWAIGCALGARSLSRLGRRRQHAVLTTFRLDAQMGLAEFAKYGAVAHSVALVGFVPETVLHVEVRHPKGTAKYDFPLWNEQFALSDGANPAGMASVFSREHPGGCPSAGSGG